MKPPHCHLFNTHYDSRIEYSFGMTKHTKIVTKTYISILLEFNYITQFDICCTDSDKVTVKYVAYSDDVLISALQK